MISCIANNIRIFYFIKKTVDTIFHEKNEFYELIHLMFPRILLICCLKIDYKNKKRVEIFLDRISFFISVLSQKFLGKSCNSHDLLQILFKKNTIHFKTFLSVLSWKTRKSSLKSIRCDDYYPMRSSDNNVKRVVQFFMMFHQKKKKIEKHQPCRKYTHGP